MAAISQYKVAAAEIVLNRRYRGDDAMLAAMLDRFAHEDGQGRAAAEYWLVWMVAVAEEFGDHAVKQVLERHRLALVR